MSLKNLGLAGAILLAVGLFTPIVSMPIVGNVNLFNNGSNWSALVLLLLAVVALSLVLKDRLDDLTWLGGAAAAILVYLFLRLEYGLAQMRQSATEELAGNPFAGLAQAALGSIQIQWGWVVLGAGAALLLYTGVKSRQQTDNQFLAMTDTASRGIATLSAVAVAAVVALDLFKAPIAPTVNGDTKANDSVAVMDTNATSTDASSGPTAEEAAYIRQHLRLYDLDARYFDSLLDGRVPGVRFKIQNNGNRTLNQVTVRVVFQDASGRDIAEEEYNPVIVSSYSMGNDNKPLRPNYIWQQEPDQFYAAKDVPSEWATGKATASIVDVEFGPNE